MKKKHAQFFKKNQVAKKINRLNSEIKVLSSEIQDKTIDHHILIEKKKKYETLVSRKKNLLDHYDELKSKS